MGPATPAFKYSSNPSPASHTSDMKVTSQKPWADITHKESDLVTASGGTKVDTWEGAKFAYKAGKGGAEHKFNSGKRAFEVGHKSEYNVNFAQTNAAVAGGQPLAVSHNSALTAPIANETLGATSGDGPTFKNDWAVNVGSTMSGHGRWVDGIVSFWCRG